MILASSLLACLLPPTPALPPPVPVLSRQDGATAQEAVAPLLKSGEQKKLVKALVGYFDAKNDDKDVLDAQAELEDTVEGLHKRREPGELIQNLADFEQAFLLSGGHKDNVKAKGRPQKMDFDGVWEDTVSYAVHAPKSYKTKDGPWPLVLIIPDGSVDLEQELRDEWVPNAPLDEMIFAMVGMPGDASTWNQLGEPGTPGGIANVLQVLGQLREQYLIDPNRTILVGHGKGASAAMDIGARYPHVFSAVALRSGEPDATDATNFGNLPTLMLNAGAGATAFQEQVGELGYDNCTVESADDLEPLWTWARERQRVAHPDHLVYSPLANFAKEAYWLKVDGFDLEASPRIEAKLDRETNSIEVTGQGFFEIVISYNDRMLDLDRPVRVVINGIEHERELKRSMMGMVDGFYYSGDPLRIFTAEAKYAFSSGDQPDEE